jgi:cobalt-zinc-cadmium efflux system outer membrane protein
MVIDIRVREPSSVFSTAPVRFRWACLLLACVLTAAHTHAEQQSDGARETLTLAAAVREATASRAEILAARFRAEALAQRPAIVRALEDPMLTPSIDHYPFEMMEEEGGARYDWSIAIEQRFPLSGVRGHRQRAAQADADRASADADRTVLEVTLDAQEAFFMLRERRRMALVLAQQRELTRELVGAAATRYAGGTGNQADVLRAEVDEARVDAAIRSLSAQIRAAEAMLNVSLGRSASAPVGELSYALPDRALLSTEILQEAALASRPELRAGKAEIDRAGAEIEVMRSMYRPMAMVRAGRAFTMAEGAGAMLMVGVSVPIWRGRLRSGVAEARAMERMANAELLAMQRMVEGEVASARAHVESASESRRALESQVLPRARMSVEAALSVYSAGQGTLISVIDAARALWEALSDLVMAETATSQAWARLERVTGGTIALESTP